MRIYTGVREDYRGFIQKLVLDIPQGAAPTGVISTLQKTLFGLVYIWVVALIGSQSLPSQEINRPAFNLEKDGKILPLPQRTIEVDEHYLTVLGIPLMADRNLVTAQPSGE